MRHRREEPAFGLRRIVLVVAQRSIELRGVRHDGVFDASVETRKQGARGMAENDLQAERERGVWDGFASFETRDNALGCSQEDGEL